MWIGSTVSMVGSRALGVVYPLLAVAVTDSSVWAGWVMFVWALPTLLYMVAGAVVDRFDPRRVLLCSQIGRGILLASAAIALAVGELLIWHLLIVAFLEASFALFSLLAETALIPALLRSKHLSGAVALHEGSVHAAVLAGRPIGGLLFGLSPVLPLLLNVLTIGTFMGSVWRIKHSFAPPAERAPLLNEIRHGISAVYKHTFLRVAMLLTASTNFVFHALVIVFIATGPPAFVAGLVLAATGVGGVAGAVLASARSQISRWIDEKTSPKRILSWLTDTAGLTREGRSTLVLHTWMWVLALVLITLTNSPLWFGLGLMCMGMAGGLSNVTIRTVMSRLTGRIVGRVAGVTRLVSYGATALGPLVGGILVVALGIQGTVLVLLGVSLVIAATVTLVPWVRKSLSPDWPIAGPRLIAWERLRSSPRRAESAEVITAVEDREVDRPRLSPTTVRAEREVIPGSASGY
ncbi:MFS transporter [[Actinomadura] parvosata]|uniref:MFS transporter n=1 Tax=[Actinomadura] parvosata TaxID=1955412 RepID=UPI00406C405B